MAKRKREGRMSGNKGRSGQDVRIWVKQGEVGCGDKEKACGWGEDRENG